MSLKYALIGCGRISPNHIVAAIENRLEIVALCDIVSSQMDNIATRFKFTNVNQYIDYKEMLAQEEIDLIAICTESGNHADIALECIDAGIHLIIEKPIALSLEEADQIIKRAKKQKVTVSACHQNRFNKSVQKMREAIEEGRFGKLLHGSAHVRWNRGENYYKQAPWRGTWEHDGGALMNQCIHNIDILRWMMGEDVVEVMGMTDNLTHDFIEAEDLGLALVKFANGSYGLIEGTTNIYPDNLEETLYIFGNKGTVKLGGKSINLIEEWRFADQLDKPAYIKEAYSENPPSIYGYGHTPLYADVIAAIKEDREPYITAEDGRKALELILAIYKSASSGQSVKLPLKKASTADFIGRFDTKWDILCMKAAM